MRPFEHLPAILLTAVFATSMRKQTTAISV